MTLTLLLTGTPPGMGPGEEGRRGREATEASGGRVSRRILIEIRSSVVVVSRRERGPGRRDARRGTRRARAPPPRPSRGIVCSDHLERDARASGERDARRRRARVAAASPRSATRTRLLLGGRTRRWKVQVVPRKVPNLRWARGEVPLPALRHRGVHRRALLIHRPRSAGRPGTP